MSAALSTSLPVQLTRLHLANMNQSALLLYGRQHSTPNDWGWKDETLDFSIKYDRNSKFDWLVQRGTETHRVPLSQLQPFLFSFYSI